VRVVLTVLTRIEMVACVEMVGRGARTISSDALARFLVTVATVEVGIAPLHRIAVGVC
jgi:hypothetical protein